MTPTARAPRPARKSRPAIFEPLEHRRLLHGGSHGLAPIWYDGGVIDDDTVPVVSVPANTASARSSDAVANAANGLPDLHSLPNAPAAIYLDFDGDAATNTDPYDEDGNPSTFNASEAANITKAWTDISTYYAMFNVDVTTVKPTKPFAWLVAGNNINGGYSGVGAFPDNNRNRPSSFNNSGDARNRTSGLAHELGHNFGLNHIADFDTDGNLVNEYSSGPDDLHGPIMGVDFARSVHKWTIGHPSNSPSDVQDDMAVIAGKIRRYDTGGDGYRPDDVGGTLATARALTASNGTYAASGIIERLADVDTYAFQSTGGSVSLSAQPNGRSGLDAKLTVLRPDGSIVAVADSAANGQQLSLDLPAGTYYAAVSGHGNAGDAGQYNLTINAPTLPAGYATSDVGNPGRPGAAGFNAATGAFTVTGSGSDIYGQSDQFRFAYQKLTGDGSITARVDGLTASQFNAKAGVMIRESLAANSRHALVEATPGLGVEFVRRAATGGASDSTRSGDFAYPVYVRIDRTGSTLRASRSTDGVNFTPIGSATISMAQTVYIGLAVSSADNGQTATATFSNVRTTGNVTSAAAATPTFNGLASPANLAVSVGTGTGLNATWDRVAGAVGYALERSADGAAFSRIATLNSAQSTYADANLAGSHRYFYRVGALDAAGAASAPSAVASAVNRPSAVRNLALTKFPNANGTQVILNWSDTDGETGYRIERATDGVTFAPIGNVGANVPSFTATGLGGNTAYQFRVVPLSNLGDGDSATVARYLPPVTGLRFTGVQPTRFSLAWTDVAGETGYRIDRSTDGETFAPYATLGAGATTFDDTGVAPLGEYFYRVTATTATETGATSATIFAAGPAAASLPAGWASADLGNVGGAGTSGYGPADGGTFTVIGSGADIWNTADEFQFASRTLTGDGQIVARLTAQQNTDFYAKAGLMVRGGLAPDAAYAFVNLTPGVGVQFESRGGTGLSSTSTGGKGGAAPVYFKLVRAGDLFTSFQSPDGTTWTPVGSATIPMGPAVYVGLAVTAHDDARLSRATFTNVAAGSTAPPSDTAAPAAPVIAAVSDDTGISSTDRLTRDNRLVLTGTAEANSTVTLRRGTALIGTATATAAGAWAFDYSAVALPDGASAFTATATDAAGNVSPASAAFTVTVDTAAPVVASGTFKYAGVQSAQVSIGEPVYGIFAPASVVVTNLGTGQTVAATATYSAASRAVAVNFPAFPGGVLPNGNYRLTMANAGLSDAAGNALASYSMDFFTLAGDANRDRAVNATDFALFRANFGRAGTWAAGDFNDDGVVTGADFSILLANYGKRLAIPIAFRPPGIAATPIAPVRTPVNTARRGVLS